MSANINGTPVTIVEYQQDNAGRMYCRCRVRGFDNILLFFADIIEVTNE